ncbi:MAG: PleD family two-component system response regulator [Chromatiaceae bacterium]|nr:PleD family two-component system response regulator [Chromatiaceae bacterium]
MLDSQNPATERASILIVDDAPANIQVLANALKADYRIRVANSGVRAIEVARATQPDLILLDVMMPELDGYEVCRRLKDDPGTSHIPVIFVTARNETQDEMRGLDLGAVDYITKPIKLPILNARVRTHVNLKLKTDLLEQLALLDGLTCIPNRRRFDQQLEQEWRRARREHSPLALVMIDVDDFKRYNDHYGHGAGDECLRRVARALSESVARASDLLARYGGEEFALLLPDTDTEGARHIAERCRAAIANLKLPHAASSVGPEVSISLGVAATGATASGAQDLLKQADRALYQAKQSGRNRVATADAET